ncbi:LysR family transcriptional regulator, glycine cleavage system transcriptional activator [Limimaricola pyoseonensis]|uniref:LysR family transcriptional regulator, glycine cleavage system transcriptional activator n=1 Tax=Limimaricola pyoseonensis TaxID=521013 RepID=A0A1G7DEG1_9RHOB|nr:LysR family transcriptional regulator, glycine cleavage system transcriptional activator [Limimaricola pyoseonensis]
MLRLSLPPLNGLRAFEVAGRHLSFRGASEELGVTQGAVAQQVRGLEQQLGLQLFLRESRGLGFTEIGRVYHAAVSQAFRQLGEATARLRPAPDQVTISVTPTFASKWLIPRLPRFAAAYPGVDLRVMATERVASFRSDGIDLAVRLGNPPFGASLRADLLFRQEVVAVCAPELLPEGRAALSAEELAGLTLLHDTHDLWPRYMADAFGPSGPASGPASGKGIRFSQTTLALDAALAGQGVALAARVLVNRDLAAGRLVQPVDHRLATGPDYYILAPRRTMSRAAEAARDWILGHSESDG